MGCTHSDNLYKASSCLQGNYFPSEACQLSQKNASVLEGDEFFLTQNFLGFSQSPTPPHTQHSLPPVAPLDLGVKQKGRVRQKPQKNQGAQGRSRTLG